MNVAATSGMTALSIGKGVTLNNAEELEAMLRHIGATRYHNLHPFHRLLHGGKLDKGQVQAWALNRYFYQSTIPLKDAMVISRFRDRATSWTRLTWNRPKASSPRRDLRWKPMCISAATGRRWRRSPPL